LLDTQVQNNQERKVSFCSKSG